ncbi:hypothetical protein J2847_001725 [Azospirillum agricola]|uniref:hypothetical protein n=1 Tax=Azospirillum agricola TaxID=1720247 RepID=UPI001AE324CE|nr:hypothetical protein [Azospirillum agricola]MBP2228434.1 hypothetical protein [Azospirillum agricola]
MERRTLAEEPARLYEAILHLRRLGHQVRRHPGPHEKGAARHLLDGAPVSDSALLELAMTRFRRAARAMGR